jgi:hypothetical protein
LQVVKLLLSCIPINPSASLSLSLAFTFCETFHKLEHLNANALCATAVQHLITATVSRSFAGKKAVVDK